MRRLAATFALSLLFLLFFAFPSHAEEVANLRPVFKPFFDDSGRLQIAIRRFERAGKAYSLIVDASSFETRIIEGEAPSSRMDISDWRGTPFIKALYRYTEPQGGLQNHGMTRAEAPAKGVFLTVDMCPSKKPFDRALFTSAVEAMKGAPAPVAIAVSGLWIERHREEFDWLTSEERAGRLAITWVNHSYSHPFDSHKGVEGNFLLMDGVDFEDEVLRNEALMIENGITPSPFFRFPGLVSDGKLLEKLRELSLTPIGADAWLAKGEAPKGGSFILVHGNGNEKEGVERFLRFYKGKEGSINKPLFLPLKDAFGG